jgi:hypothetical protein
MLNLDTKLYKIKYMPLFGGEPPNGEALLMHQHFSLLRRVALNALNRQQTYKRSLKQKIKRTKTFLIFFKQTKSDKGYVPNLKVPH